MQERPLEPCAEPADPPAAWVHSSSPSQHRPRRDTDGSPPASSPASSASRSSCGSSAQSELDGYAADGADLSIGDAHDLVVAEDIEAELAGEDEDDNGADAPKQALVAADDLHNVLKSRMKQDGLDEAVADEAATFLASSREQHAQWSRTEGNLEAADEAYKSILAEFETKKAELEEALGADGIVLRLAPLPPNNPLSSFLLDWLFWAHRGVSLQLGYFDRSIPTYNNLAQYAFWQQLKDGTTSAVETHVCADHSSSTSDPSFPKNSNFPCDARIREFCDWFSTTIYSARLRLQTPGVIFSYGAFNKKYLRRIREASDISFDSYTRTVSSTDVRASTPIPPRQFNLHVFRDPRTGKIYGGQYDVDHPSATGYASQAGASTSARSYALSLDRALEEKVMISGIFAPGKPSFFSRQAFAMAKRQDDPSAKDAGRTWGIKVSTLYSEEKRERQELENKDPQAAAASTGYSLPFIVKQLGFGLARSVERWANTYAERWDEFSTVAGFASVPPPQTLLAKALWATRWHTQLLRRISRPLGAADASGVMLVNAPSGIPLAQTGTVAGIAISKQRTGLPRPIQLDAATAASPFLANSSVGAPLAQAGSTAITQRGMATAGQPRPIGIALEHGASPFLANAPSGVPLAQAGRLASTFIDSRVAALRAAHPVPTERSDSPFLKNTSNGLPLAQAGGTAKTRTSKLSFGERPLAAGNKSPFVLNSALGTPLARGGQDATMDAAQRGRSARPLALATPVFVVNSASGVPLAVGGVHKERIHSKTVANADPRPIPSAQSRLFLANTPHGAPLALPSVSRQMKAGYETTGLAHRPFESSTASIFIRNTPAGPPLALHAHSVQLSAGRRVNREAARPLPSAAAPSAFLRNSTSGLPLGLSGSTAALEVSQARARDVARPLRTSKESVGDVFLGNSPSGIPFAVSSAAASADARIRAKHVPRPAEGVTTGSVFAANSPGGIPLSIEGRLKVYNKSRKDDAGQSSKKAKDGKKTTRGRRKNDTIFEMTLADFRSVTREKAKELLGALTTKQLQAFVVQLGLTTDPSAGDVAPRFAAFIKATAREWKGQIKKGDFVDAAVGAIYDPNTQSAAASGSR
ncbi:hypothetical protein Rhopal_003071-T1 [Rhodotorula paludigena]|uniref:Proteophosphoglycan ppg4 n=1 Tax=Rhodotorula paludigena TaxID=86838 RepID=A0AAV5GIS5_9BASI|nr:hypothetical protein Rhopal_003071-T1 [Rhodotorula paludigena]